MNGYPASHALRAGTYALAAAGVWPVIELLGGMLSRSHHPIQTVWFRYAAHVAILLAVVVPRRDLAAFRTRRPLLQLLRGVLMCLMPLSYLRGAAVGVSADLWGLFWLAPLMIVLAGGVLLGERPGAVRWVAGLLGFAGAVVVFGPGAGVADVIIPGLIMAATFAGYVITSRVLRDEPLAASLLYTGLGALVPLLLFLPGRWSPVGPSDLLVVAALGVTSLVFLAFVDRATEAYDTSFVAPLLFAIVPFEAVGVAIRGVESSARGSSVGHGLVALGIIALTFDRSSFRAGRSKRGTS